MTLKQTGLWGLLSATVASSGCDDKPPPGLIDALQHALAGELLGCPAQKCNQANEVNISPTDTATQVEAAAKQLVRNWCPTYVPKVTALSKNSSGKLSANRAYKVSVVGFGEIAVETSDVNATITAREAGWKLEITHNHEAGSGMCPAEWPAGQCKVQPEYELKSDGEINISWVAGTDTKTASGKASEVIKFSTATAIGWCDKRNHTTVATQLTCGPATTDGAARTACTSDADCAQLPCGEWQCKDGFCLQLEKAPDGTPCNGGAGVCRDGKCG